MMNNRSLALSRIRLPFEEQQEEEDEGEEGEEEGCTPIAEKDLHLNTTR